jgi:hypothetical protein
MRGGGFEIMSNFNVFLSQGGLQIGYRWGKKYESGKGGNGEAGKGKSGANN